jgi:hypothetical protein
MEEERIFQQSRIKPRTCVLMQFGSNFIRLVTKSEPGAVATGQGFNSKMDASNTKSLKNLSIRPVATAPGSDFVLACSPCS